MHRLHVIVLFFLGSVSFFNCAVHPKTPFDAAHNPAVPDYGRMENWAAHPDKKDPADQTPDPGLKDLQDGSAVDVFFLYPTTYTGSIRDQRNWNAAMDDAQTNKKTDEGTVLFQASIFNGAGRVFVPRYRQAHLTVFFSKDTVSSQKALDLAYEDTKAAFDYYLKHWNQGRPFIIASHSQGARHAMFLLRDKIEGTALEKQLVAAYLVGWPVRDDFFKKLKPCTGPSQTGCYCTWRTWEKNAGRRRKPDPGVVCTNPLTWTIKDGEYAPKSANLGGVIRPFAHIYPHIVDAEVHRGLLLASRPKFSGSFFFRRKNYHVGDLNLFYLNVRENAQKRAAAFLKQ